VSIVSLGPSERSSGITNLLSAITIDEGRIGELGDRLLEEMSTGKRSIYYKETYPVPWGFYEGHTLAEAPRT